MNYLPMALSATLLSLLTSLPAQQKIHDLFDLGKGGAQIGRSHESVANMGDLDGDGIDDLVAGATYSRANPSYTGSVFVYSSRTGKQIARIDGGSSNRRFGFCVENLGDVNKDGVDDFGVGSPEPGRSGVVFVYSGKTRKLIYSIAPGGEYGSDFGYSMAGLGDLNSDGYADFVVGAPKVGNRGIALVYSGKTGTFLRSIIAAVPTTRFAQAIVALPDIDGDKIGDMAIIAHKATIASKSENVPIWWYSGKTGKLIRRVLANRTFPSNPVSLLRTCDDVDGDKKREVLIGFPFGSSGNRYYGEVHIYSSGTGSLLRRIRLPSPALQSGFGSSFDGLPDMDQDGSPEIIVGDPAYTSGMTSRGAIHIFSAKSGKLIESITTPGQKRNSFYFGQKIAFLGDLNRDGNWDFYSHVYQSSPTTDWLKILSALPLDLSTDKHAVSIFKGGKVVLSIHAGSKHAKDLFIMIGSASGSYPGIKIGQNTLHLNMDSYLTFTLAAPHAVFFNNVSLLDAKGEAKVGFTLPSGLPASIAGTRLHHSCLLIGKGRLDFANIAAPLDITLF